MSEIAATDTATHDLETYRGELTGYCYRMLGSAHDADDAVQEAMVRAWQAFDRFEGRSAVRSWLYRIATNVCLDMLRSRKRRALPMDLSAPVPSSTEPVATLPESAWVEPLPGDGPLPPDTDPAGRVVLQDTIRLAFISALQNLPPRQRAVLILREVLCWQASEVADLLDTTVVSVNSALQRARTTMAASDQAEDQPSPQLAEAEQDLLARYVDAFQRYDIDRLVALLHEDASISMPPFEMWIRGPGGAAGLVHRLGQRLRGVPAHPGHRQRLTRVRAVQAQRGRDAPGALVYPGPGDLGGRDQPHPSLHRHRHAACSSGSACPRTSTGRASQLAARPG